MDGRAVSVRVAGQSYKVVSSSSEEDLLRLASTVNAKVEELIPPGKAATNGQAVLLAAIALAHELEQERAKRQQVERRAKDMLKRVLGRLDEALDSRDD